MKNYTLLIFLLCCVSWGNAQTDNIIFKDGKSVPGRKAFMENCTAGLKSSSKKGKASASQNNYCSCVINAISNTYTLDEFLENVGKLDKILEDETAPIYKLVKNCATENLDSNSFKTESEKKQKNSKKEEDDDVLQNMYEDKNFETGFISSCKEAFANAVGFEKGQMDADKYCRCAFDKMREKKVALADMGNCRIKTLHCLMK